MAAASASPGDTLLKNSDSAMYHAKESGRNNCQLMNQQATERHSLSIELRHTLERNELLLYFQPVIDMLGGRLSSIEVLLSLAASEPRFDPAGQIHCAGGRARHDRADRGMGNTAILSADKGLAKLGLCCAETGGQSLCLAIPAEGTGGGY